MSTARQLKGDSLRRQLQESAKYAAAHGLKLEEDILLRDIGVSAYTGENAREGALARFLNLVTDGQIEAGSYLLVESLDRLSRQKILESQPIFNKIISSGINIVTLVDKRLYKAYTNEVGDFIYSLIAFSRANDESATKSFRLRQSWEAKRKIATSKKITSWCPAWLTLDKNIGEFVTIPDRVQIVQSIFNDCAAGIGMYAITRRLNEGRVSPFHGDSWHMSYVSKILNNRAVLGEFQPHKRNADGRRIVEGSPIRNYYPAVVSEELFLRCESARSSRNLRSGSGKGRKGKSLSNLFSGIAKCAYCMGNMHYENKGEGRKGGRYLVCAASIRGACGGIRWRYTDFETTFLSFVKELGLNELVGPDENRRNELIGEIGSLEGKEQSLSRRRSALIEMLSLVQNKQTLASEYDSVEGDIISTKDKIVECRKKLMALTLRSEDFYESRNSIKAILQKFEESSVTDVYRVRSLIATRIRAIVEQVMVASLGSQPFVASMLLKEMAKHNADETKVQDLEESLSAPDTVQRYISVRFKDGSLRVLLPHKSDPMRMDVFAFGRDVNEMTRYSADGTTKRLPAPVTDIDEWYAGLDQENQS